MTQIKKNEAALVISREGKCRLALPKMNGDETVPELWVLLTALLIVITDGSANDFFDELVKRVITPESQ